MLKVINKISNNADYFVKQNKKKIFERAKSYLKLQCMRNPL